MPVTKTITQNGFESIIESRRKIETRDIFFTFPSIREKKFPADEFFADLDVCAIDLMTIMSLSL
jgi:hypothetical protein